MDKTGGAAVKKFLDSNRDNYEKRYGKGQSFLRYPADWIIRFHNMYLKEHIPQGRVLDYGCGAGNNTAFFIENGYETYGVEVADAALSMIRTNLEARHLDIELAKRFSIIAPGSVKLPHQDGFFDVIISNQTLYYLSSEEQIKKVTSEFFRCLRPGGVVFFTMLGPRHYYITHHAKSIHGRVYEVSISGDHRLRGLKQFIYLVRDEDELKALFCDFECLTTGYFDQRMFDLMCGFHWIFVGKKASG